METEQTPTGSILKDVLESKTLRVFVGTWNMMGKPPPDTPLAPFLTGVFLIHCFVHVQVTHNITKIKMITSCIKYIISLNPSNR